MNSEKLYDIIVKPVITEKASYASENNKVIFQVNMNSNKAQIKEAVEKLFKVKVIGVNTITVKGKKKRFRGKPYMKSDMKKAIVSIAQGQSIDVTTGV